MNIRRLRCFLAAAEESNFGRAADRLNIVHSAFSRQIQHLEADLGVELFIRSGRRVTLSDAGRFYAGKIRAVLTALDQANEDLRSMGRRKSAQIRIGLQENIGSRAAIVLLLQKVAQSLPDITLNYVPLNSRDQPDALVRDAIDIGIIYGDPMITTGLHHMLLGTDRYDIAMDIGHPLAARDSLRLSDLADENFVHIAHGTNQGLQDELMTRCQQLGFSPRIVQRAPSVSGIFALLATHVGVSFMPRLISRPEDIVVRPVEDLDVEIPVSLIWGRNVVSDPVRRFIDVFTAMVNESGALPDGMKPPVHGPDRPLFDSLGAGAA